MESAFGFIRDGAFDEFGGEGGVEVVAPEGGAVGEIELCHGLEGAERALLEGAEEFGDLVADLVANLVGRSALSERGA